MAKPSGTVETAIPPGKRRFLVGAFIILWLAVQIIVPFVNKFELPSFRYRNIANFGWSPFSTPSMVYELSLYAEGEDGEKEPIPNIERYVMGLRSPGPIRLTAPNYGVEHVQNRYARLVTHIAKDRQDGRIYVVSIHWIRHYPADLPDQWEFRTQGIE